MIWVCIYIYAYNISSSLESKQIFCSSEAPKFWLPHPWSWWQAVESCHLPQHAGAANINRSLAACGRVTRPSSCHFGHTKPERSCPSQPWMARPTIQTIQDHGQHGQPPAFVKVIQQPSPALKNSFDPSHWSKSGAVRWPSNCQDPIQVTWEGELHRWKTLVWWQHNQETNP